MPGFDGTGPAGMGSMTGRGMGYCAMPLGGNTYNPYFRPANAVARPRGFSNFAPYFPQNRIPVRLGMGNRRGRRGFRR